MSAPAPLQHQQPAPRLRTCPLMHARAEAEHGAAPADDRRGAPAPGGGSSVQRQELGLHAFWLLLAMRIVNALTTRTFFQPDEFFQSLEPAWQMAFGEQSGAWITWEWKNQLRSSLHPALFAGLFAGVSAISDICSLPLAPRAELLIAAPKITQAALAASTDYFTWRLARQAYGARSSAAWASLALTACSPWQWFCSTRTLSNCLETTLTAAALVWWPWQWPLTSYSSSTTTRPSVQKGVAPRIISAPLGDLHHLRLSLLAAALACVLRPTNGLIWMCISAPTLWQASTRERLALVKWAVLCGCGVLTLSALADRRYYGVWTFPPLRFVHFNIAKSLAVFYGTNRPDYYLTEGLPLLLTTALPFAAYGIQQAIRGSGRLSPMLSYLALTCGAMVGALSFVAHKEVRFIYPLLPMLHVLAAQPVSCFFHPLTPSKKAMLGFLLAINVLVAGYGSLVHQRGVVDVLHMLRHQHESQALGGGSGNTTVGFLMPCHSTPWRSHLVYPDITAWALTCEPPIDVPLDRRASYLDEADEFYIDPGPVAWLDQHMESVGTIRGKGHVSKNKDEGKTHNSELKRPWPKYLVFFQQLEGTLAEFLRGTKYKECWRGFNSHFHDDSRRRGDVIAWCLDDDGADATHGHVEQHGLPGTGRISSGQWGMGKLRG
ncbi:glycosyltransferase family 22 protein [Diplodia corticola]|uniref:Mannosyltransferase n=1 Tax=Diplodia corticola TaxID=236234 RepID=A0A1J9RBW2_9PEZI|nr:glycosyltransferase family 22 protein [Diplodia corticola]OJD29947.1 glycosyltransferase family 22 protein [Diplodia corticola]